MSTGIGETLREARVAQGRSLDEVAHALRARTSQLTALEAEDFGSFGGDVYAKGFLKSYAVELGLDPAPLLDQYRREVGDVTSAPAPVASGVGRPPRQRAAPAPWMAWVLASVVVLAGLFLIGQFGGAAPDTAAPTAPASPPPQPADTGTDDDEPADSAGVDEPTDGDGDADGQTDQDADPEPEPDPEPQFEGVEVVLALEEQSWMRVIVDGAVVLEQTLPAGTIREWQGQQEIQVRLGNAGGVRAQRNGEDVGALGGRGAVVEVVFTPDDAETL